MTTTTTTDTPTRARITSGRVAAIAALVGGAAFVVDTVTITLVNSSFGMMDDALFYTGLAAFVVTLVALAVRLSMKAHGIGRVALGAAVFLALLVGGSGVSLLMDAIGRRVFSDANVGLHGEWSFFSIGVGLLVFAGWAIRRL